MKKIKGVFNQFLTASLFLAAFGCKKGIVENQADPLLSTGKQNSTVKTLGATPDVYVAGFKNGAAVYWKNGVATILMGGTEATGIEVVGNDVHVSGKGVNSSTGAATAIYWLNNGLPTVLDNGGTTDDAWTTGITVVGTHVYISGFLGRYSQKPVYWLDGVLTPLDLNYSGKIAGPIRVGSNGEILIPNMNGNSYWNNGTEITLQKPTAQPAGASVSAYANGITVNGTDVYVLGNAWVGAIERAVYWKNGGAPISLSSVGYGRAYDLKFTASGSFYISGYQGASESDTRLGIWNNGLPAMTAWGTKSYIGIPRMAVNGDDIYICGGEMEGTTTLIAKYWLNGTAVPLTDASSYASASDIKVY